MRNILFSFLMAGALTMGGCASVFPQNGLGYVSEIDTPQEAVAAAELTFQGALTTVAVLDQQGLIDAAAAAKLQPVFTNAYAKLLAARQLVDAGAQAATALKDLDAAIALLSSVVIQAKQESLR